MPNSIKLTLPQSKKDQSPQPLSRVIIDSGLNYYVAFGNEKEKPVDFNDIASFLNENQAKNPDMYVALYADETIPYKEVVKILDIANRNHYRMVIVTHPVD